MVVINYQGHQYDLTVLDRYDRQQRTYVLVPISDKVVPPNPPKTKEWLEAKQKKQEEIYRITKEWKVE